jgi:hypothetical protein
MATELTAEQAKKCDDYALEMIKNGIKCGIKTNREKAMSAVHVLYQKYLDIPNGPKEVVFVDSPESAIMLVAKSQKLDPKELIAEVQFLNLWTSWVAYYHAGVNILGETGGADQELLDNLNEYEGFTKIIHAILPCENVCFVIEYPKVVAIKNNDLDAFKLHRENGLAIEYNDGTGFAWLNGVEVPDYVAVTPGSKLSVKKVMAETNVDVRREGLRRISLSRLLKDTKAKLLDSLVNKKLGKWCDYQLYDMNLGDGKKRIFLRMFDVASNGRPLERVEDNITTVAAALAWRDGETVSEYKNPRIRT